MCGVDPTPDSLGDVTCSINMCCLDWFQKKRGLPSLKTLVWLFLGGGVGIAMKIENAYYKRRVINW